MTETSSLMDESRTPTASGLSIVRQDIEKSERCIHFFRGNNEKDSLFLKHCFLCNPNVYEEIFTLAANFIPVAPCHFAGAQKNGNHR